MSVGSSNRITRARDVDAPPSEVWAVLAAFGSIAEWAPNIDHSTLMSDQTSGVGAERRVQSGHVVVVERVATWEPTSMLSYSIEGLPPAISRVCNTWVLRPNGEGSAVTLITDIVAVPTPLGRLVGRVVARQLARAADQLLDGIAAHTKEPA